MEEFEVIFLDEDRKTVLASLKVEKGGKASFPGNTPTKPAINGVRYNFIKWIGEEKLNNVTAKLILIAKYEAETNTVSNEQALFDASLKNAEVVNYNVVVEAGQKALSQQQAIEKDTRSSEEIVNDIMENGKTEVGKEVNKDMEK